MISRSVVETSPARNTTIRRSIGGSTSGKAFEVFEERKSSNATALSTCAYEGRQRSVVYIADGAHLYVVVGVGQKVFENIESVVSNINQRVAGDNPRAFVATGKPVDDDTVLIGMVNKKLGGGAGVLDNAHVVDGGRGVGTTTAVVGPSEHYVVDARGVDAEGTRGGAPVGTGG